MRHVQGYSRSHWTLPSGDYSLHIAPAAARATANKTKMKKCTKKTGHFDGPGGAQVQYRAHCPIEEVQGFTRSHWMPPLFPININWTYLRRFFLVLSLSTRTKRLQVDAKAPVFNRGITYQTKEKGLTKVSIYFLGGGLVIRIKYGGVVSLLHL
jgi:hypothetical protein